MRAGNGAEFLPLSCRFGRADAPANSFLVAAHMPSANSQCRSCGDGGPHMQAANIDDQIMMTNKAFSVAFSTLIATMLFCLFCWSPPAIAQTGYPTQPIHLLVGFPGGTAPDIGARVLGDKLGTALGKPIVIESIAGASGNIAGARVARSEPDGHTLILAANSGIVINPHLYQKMPYDPAVDLIPVTQVFSYANVLVVNNNVPVTNVQELVGLAKARPGTLTISHAGV